ncbi:MAG: replication-associated recombination protein A [Gammaproteobacteria bacterium]|nr:replication-associated recombination protein A [Gammaproteobacteria bacterium]
MSQDDLFAEPAPRRHQGSTGGSTGSSTGTAAGIPLAERMRPRLLDEFVGQRELMGADGPLRRLLESGRLQSLVLWGPPGCGKTTFGRLVAAHLNAPFRQLSAVLAGVKDVRAVVEEAQRLRARGGPATVLFVDEVHRFNKAQQDAFLPFVEDGTIVFVGATTENPSFELNNALLSRARVLVFKPLGEAELDALVERALSDVERGVGALGLSLSPAQRATVVRACDGDARRALNFVELIAELCQTRGLAAGEVPQDVLEQALDVAHLRRYDKGGDAFYDLISAFHKSIRGSDPDAALYWLARMLDGGCDPLYVARRLVRIASEDVGLADPRALSLTLDVWDTQLRLGSPEGELALAHAAVHLACTEKSNAVYNAFNAAMEEVKRQPSLEVPKRLRNAPTRLMASLGHAEGYRYAHDEPDAYAAGEHYFPDEMPRRRYYQPTRHGAEARYAARLQALGELDRESAASSSRPATDSIAPEPAKDHRS